MPVSHLPLPRSEGKIIRRFWCISRHRHCWGHLLTAALPRFLRDAQLPHLKAVDWSFPVDWRSPLICASPIAVVAAACSGSHLPSRFHDKVACRVLPWDTWGAAFYCEQAGHSRDMLQIVLLRPTLC
uniref:Uncharacterized protein n=1 Tax=Trypanosoma congolense (strain IL3000) TaxID=1068625 RepID=G0V1C7_TRYCI|nr:hypothetical protein, unlikely [Trypanosoma congolense IL3000]